MCKVWHSEFPRVLLSHAIMSNRVALEKRWFLWQSTSLWYFERDKYVEMLVPLFFRELRPGRRPAWQFSWQYFESMRDDWGQRLPNCGSRKSEINVVERTRIWRYRQEIRLPSIRTFMRRAKKCYLRRYNLFAPALIAPWPVRDIPHVFSRSSMGCWCRVRSWEYKLVHRIEILFMCKIQVRSCTLSSSFLDVETFYSKCHRPLLISTQDWMVAILSP